MKSSFLAALISFLPFIPSYSQVSAPNQTPADLDRSKPVPPSPPRPFQMPPIQESSLVKGIKLALIEVKRDGIPLGIIHLHFPLAGAAYEPQGKTGLAGFVVKLMKEGTSTLNRDEFEKELQKTRDNVSVTSTEEEMIVTVVYTAKETVDRIMSLTADMVQHPAFPAPELKRMQKEALAGLQQEKGDPGTLAEKRLTERFYEATRHPYFRQVDGASIQSITREDVVRFYSERVGPGTEDKKVTVATSGPLSRSELAGLVQKYFGDWSAPVSVGPTPSIPTLSEFSGAKPAGPGGAKSGQGMAIDIIDMPESEQSAIRMGHLSITADDPDYLVVRVMNEILGGGGILSRLDQNLREGKDKNWAYGASSSVGADLHVGTFIVSVDVQTDATAKALMEIRKEIDRLRSELVSADDLATMKQSMWGDFLRAQETVQGAAGEVGAIEVYGRPKDSLATYRKRLNAVTAEQILQAAKRHLRPEELQIVIAGDAAKIKGELKAIAPVRVLDLDRHCMEGCGEPPSGRTPNS